jgi:hypothetical protein
MRADIAVFKRDVVRLVGCCEDQYKWSRRVAFKIADNTIRNWTSSDRHRPLKLWLLSNVIRKK